jgi:large subunit ribosomal protein L31
MKKGIHPLRRMMRVVMRNGASFQVQTVLNRTAPYMLQVDTTTHPAWTGEKAGLSMEDERIARLYSRYSGFVSMGDTPAVAAPLPGSGEAVAEGETA